MDLSYPNTVIREENGLYQADSSSRDGVVGVWWQAWGLAGDLRVAGATLEVDLVALPLRQDGLEVHCDGLGVLRPGGAALVVGSQHAGVEGLETLGGDLVDVFTASTAFWRTAMDGVHGRQVLVEDVLGVEEGSGDLDFTLGIVGQ